MRNHFKGKIVMCEARKMYGKHTGLMKVDPDKELNDRAEKFAKHV